MIATAQPREDQKNANTSSPHKQAKSVLLIDPYPVSRLGVKVLFSQHFGPAEISETSCHQEGSSLLQTLQPDLLILNLHLKDETFLNLIHDAHHFSSQTLILGFGDRLDQNRSHAAVRAGLHGLVELQQSPEDFILSMDALLNGERYFSRRNRACFLSEALFSPDKPTDAPLRVLSNRELQIFQLIGQGWSIQQMAKSIHRSPKTVETYREHIKCKFGIESACQLHKVARTWVESGVIDLETKRSIPHLNAL